MNELDNRIAEAFERLLGSNEALGITKGKPEIDEPNRLPRQYEYIRGLFGLKVSDSLFYESLCSAFYDIHSYRYVDDPLFCESLSVRLKAIGTPQDEICKACNAVSEIIKDMHKEYGLAENQAWSEKAAGWHPNIAGIIAVSQDFNKKEKKEEPYSGGGPWPLTEEIKKIISKFDKNIVEYVNKKFKIITEELNADDQNVQDALGATPQVLLYKTLAAFAENARKQQTDSQLSEFDVRVAAKHIIELAEKKDVAIVDYLKKYYDELLKDKDKIFKIIQAAYTLNKLSTKDELKNRQAPVYK